MRKPNIIFILTDDQRWDALGYAGNPLVHTPEIDRLAAAGTILSKRFAAPPFVLSVGPVCYAEAITAPICIAPHFLYRRIKWKFIHH